MDIQILNEINKNNINSLDLAQKLNKEHNSLVGILNSLVSKEYLVITPVKKDSFKLTKEGLEYHKNGTPEYQVLCMIDKDNGVEKKLVEEKLNKNFKVGLSNGLKKKWFKLDKDLIKLNDKKLEDIKDEDKCLLDLIQCNKGGEINKKDLTLLKKRKLVEVKVINSFLIEKGSNFKLEIKEEFKDLTFELINSKKYKTIEFSKFNMKSKGTEINVGSLHPLLKVRSQFRGILLEMGFEEMKTNQFVESSFWNFDSLFQPQQHPARDSHDTFFLKNPKYCKIDNEEYWKKVKNMHEKGGFGSFGWNYDWSYEEAQKNIFRTHTTAVSSKMLKKLADDGFKDVKYFSIDRVFRNETLDATHLAEFHQIEGLVCGKNLGLAHLKGIITEFFKKIGITQLRFKPAYNPYTEPSMEIFVYHPILKKTIEIGNSGIFRPEMLRPMGLPEDTSVIAWGLGLERPTMIQYGISNIRELFGHKINVKSIRDNPICIFNN